MTNDGLTAFKRIGGQEGTEVVPNLAVSLAPPTDGGRTYTFTVRKGIRYSTGRLVRPADFKHALERLFELGSFDAPIFGSIAGADECLRRKGPCNLSRGIVTNDQSGTIVFRLEAPDPDFPAKLAMPIAVAVPPTVPSKDQGRRPLPATGPYMHVSYVPGRQVRLVRNPRFREWSRTARPDGYPDEIVLRLGVSVKEQIAAVGRGRADVSDLSLRGESEIARLRNRYGNRVHSDPGPAVIYTFLNTRIPPFDDIRVRRALNYAVDRDAVVQTLGGPDRASPTCQILPQNYPGYRPYCPYSRDLARAKELVAASGSRGTPVLVWTRASYAPFFAHVAKALKALGYPARLKVVEDLEYYNELGKFGASNVQAGYLGWAAGLPTPAEYLQSFLDFLRSVTPYSDRAVDRKIARAIDLQATDPVAANELWTEVDRTLVDRAHLVPLYNIRAVGFVSSRLGNYQFHPFAYQLLDQMWVR
ncbi:ABC transporter substrate-binding protein [soil metagenome]